MEIFFAIMGIWFGQGVSFVFWVLSEYVHAGQYYNTATHWNCIEKLISTNWQKMTSIRTLIFSTKWSQCWRKLGQSLDAKDLSHKKQNTINVELLIKAHQCVVHECFMEGIAIVLQRTKILNGVLTKAKSWNLIVKMLIGIGQYRDMYYCFETLDRLQFVSLWMEWQAFIIVTQVNSRMTSQMD